MARIRCSLIADANSLHLRQIHAGFLMLGRRGMLDLTESIRRRQASPQTRSESAALTVVINGRLRLRYDAGDSERVDPEALAGCDHYFKRSYSTAHLEPLGAQAAKVHPLDPGHQAWIGDPGLAGACRGLMLKIGLSGLQTPLGELKPRINRQRRSGPDTPWALPDVKAEPRILFMARAWDPHDAPARSPEQAERRDFINRRRARCIELLRREFGRRFHGGFSPEPYAQAHYPHLLLPEQRLSNRTTYLELLRRHPICVAGTGPHGAPGWKLAEYLGFARAILAERPLVAAPMGLRREVNYLEFDRPEQCVEQAARLLEDAELRARLMRNNFRHYHMYLRPDVLVMGTLAMALTSPVRQAAVA